MKILAADDDALSLRVLQRSLEKLEKWGYGVVTATDGSLAWKALLEDLAIAVMVADDQARPVLDAQGARRSAASPSTSPSGGAPGSSSKRR